MCIVATPPCDLRWHMNNVCFSAVSCVAFMWTYGFVWTFVCPSVLTPPPLPFLFDECLCVWWVQRSLPFLTSACIDHFQDSLFTTLNATLFWMCGPFVASTSNQHQNLKTFRRTWSCTGLPRLWRKPSRELPVCIIFYHQINSEKLRDASTSRIKITVTKTCSQLFKGSQDRVVSKRRFWRMFPGPPKPERGYKKRVKNDGTNIRQTTLWQNHAFVSCRIFLEFLAFAIGGPVVGRQDINSNLRTERYEIVTERHAMSSTYGTLCHLGESSCCMLGLSERICCHGVWSRFSATARGPALRARPRKRVTLIMVGPDRVFHYWSNYQDQALLEREELIRMENTHVLATIADGKTAASWGEGKKTAKTHLESAFEWVLIGWVLGRSLRFAVHAAHNPRPHEPGSDTRRLGDTASVMWVRTPASTGSRQPYNQSHNPGWRKNQNSGCRKRRSANLKGVRSLFSSLVTFWSLFLSFCHFFVAFLPDSFCRTPSAAGWATGNRNRRNPFSYHPLKLCWNAQQPVSAQEPSEPRTGTARTVPWASRNRTEPGPPWQSHVFTISTSTSISSQRIYRGPKTHPKSRNTKKTPRSHELFQKVRANVSLLSCDTSQESSGNCSDKLVQMNFFILGGFFRVDFPPLNLLPGRDSWQR